MTSRDWGNLAYLVLLGAVLGFWFWTRNRASLGRVLQQAIAWGLIFVGAIAVVGLWDDIRRTVRPSQAVITDQGRVEVPRAHDGHYYLTLLVNGVAVEFMVDTGASQVVLTEADAARIGLETADLAYVGRAMTANGEVRTAPVRLESVALGPVVDRDLRAYVNRGEMDKSLLGMSWLQRWRRIEISGGALVLTR